MALLDKFSVVNFYTKFHCRKLLQIDWTFGHSGSSFYLQHWCNYKHPVTLLDARLCSGSILLKLATINNPLSHLKQWQVIPDIVQIFSLVCNLICYIVQWRIQQEGRVNIPYDQQWNVMGQGRTSNVMFIP